MHLYKIDLSKILQSLNSCGGDITVMDNALFVTLLVVISI